MKNKSGTLTKLYVGTSGYSYKEWKGSLFVYFKHEDEGKGPQLAKRFLELAA